MEPKLWASNDDEAVDVELDELFDEVLVLGEGEFAVLDDFEILDVNGFLVVPFGLEGATNVQIVLTRLAPPHPEPQSPRRAA